MAIMRQSLLLVGIASLLPLAGCGGKKRILAESGGGAAEGTTLTVNDYKAPETFAVKSFEVPLEKFSIVSPLSSEAPTIADEIVQELPLSGISPLSDKAQRFPGRKLSGPIRLIDDKPVRFYTGFPIELKFSMALEGGKADMLVNFGFIEVPPENATPAQIASLHRCNIGSSRAEVSEAASSEESDEAKVQSFDAKLPIPLECLKNGEPTRLMLFAAFNPDGAVQTEEGDSRKIIVFDKETVEKNNVCFKFQRNATECQNEIYLERSPGANVHLSSYAGESSVAVLPNKDPAVYIQEEKRLPNPFFKSAGEVILEGIAPDDPEINLYSVRMKYSLCQGNGDKAALTDDCDAAIGWQDLQLFEQGLPTDPLQEGFYQTLKDFVPTEPLAFSVPLHLTGSVYELLARKGTGAWKDESNFRIRACAKLYKNEQITEQKNLDSQVVDGNPEADDCIVFPIYVVEGRADALDRCQEAASQSLRSATNDSPCREESEASPFVTDNSGDNSFAVDKTNKVVNPTLSFSKGWSGSWGNARQFATAFSADPRLNITPMRLTASSESKLSTRGILSIDLFEASMTTSLDLSEDGKHYLEPSFEVFGQRIYGSRQTVSDEFLYELPIKPISGSSGSKRVPKGSRLTIDNSNKDSPVVKTLSVNSNPNALFVREVCKGSRMDFSVISVGFSLCAEGGLFATAGAFGYVRLPNETEETSYPGGIRRAALAYYFNPSVAATAQISASVSLVVVRGGVIGTVRLIQVGLPSIAEVASRNFKKTLTNDGVTEDGYGMLFDANFKSDLDIDWLTGSLKAYADVRTLDWCKAWIFWYPCGWSWSRVAEKYIVRFSGGGADYRLANTKLTRYRADPYWTSL
jgi:hypothetical protein